MGWFFRKAENGLMFNDTKPNGDESYVELSFDTPDSTLYGTGGVTFEQLLEIAKKAEPGSLVLSYYEHKGE